LLKQGINHVILQQYPAADDYNACLHINEKPLVLYPSTIIVESQMFGYFHRYRFAMPSLG
jgi:hypothetical protein